MVLACCRSEVNAAPTSSAVSAQASTTKFGRWEDGSLHGANIYQRRLYSALDDAGVRATGGAVGPRYSQADLDRLAAAGANLVVISHPGLFSEAPPYRLDEAVAANLDDLVAKATAADLLIVIAARTGPGRSEFTFEADEVGTWFDASYLNDKIWSDPAAGDAWVAMWRETAKRYRGNPNIVGYDMMVEPNPETVLHDEDPAHFAAAHAGTAADWNTLHPRVAAAIRGEDAETPILLSPIGWASPDWLDVLKPATTTGVVYTVHLYDPSSYTHQERRNTGDAAAARTFQADVGRSAKWALAQGGPLAVTEYGVDGGAPNADRYLTAVGSALRNAHVSSAVWVWDASVKGWSHDSFSFETGEAAATRLAAISKTWKR